MRDGQGRIIDYMRISITDRCNLRCRYCMPQNMETVEEEQLLTAEEFFRIVQAGAHSGIVHYRLTGGEPLARRDCIRILEGIRQIPGVETVSMTTNGVLLEQYAKKLGKAGLNGLNVSLDTLDEQEFEVLTGSPVLEEVKRGIDGALDAGIPVKINTVNDGDRDYRSILTYGEQRGIPIRFIEMMPIGYGRKYTGAANRLLLEELERVYGKAECCDRAMGNGPACYYQFPGLLQPVGFISAVHHKFCERCSRVRITAEGYLKLCLCYDRGVDLREFLRNGGTDFELEKVMELAVLQKPYGHCFESPDKITEEKAMVKIGG